MNNTSPRSDGTPGASQKKKGFMSKKDSMLSGIVDAADSKHKQMLESLKGKGKSDGLNSVIHHIGTLRENDYFGEVGLVTNLKRTASVRAKEYVTLAQMSKDTLMLAKREYPHIYQVFQEKIGTYKDHDMVFRKKMVQNLPYFRKLDSHIIGELVNHLTTKRYEADALICGRGDEKQEIMFLKAGVIVIEVPVINPDSNKVDESIYMDWLNEGSCFCVYNSFNKDMCQLVNFRACSTCIIDSISLPDLMELQRSNIQLSDTLKKVEIEILNGEKSEHDFFRYRPPREGNSQNIIKSMIRKKFRESVIRYCKEIQSGERKVQPALEALRRFQSERKKQRVKLNQLKFNQQTNKQRLFVCEEEPENEDSPLPGL